MSTTEERTAYHEAGHAVLSYLFELPVESVTIVPAEGYLGKCQGESVPWWCHHIDANGIDTRDKRGWAHDTIVVLFGGVEAERLLDPEIPAADLEDGGAKDNGVIVDLLLELAADEDEQEALSEYLARRTRNFLRQYWPSVQAVALALLERKTLTGQEVADLIYSEVPGSFAEEEPREPLSGDPYEAVSQIVQRDPLYAAIVARELAARLSQPQGDQPGVSAAG